MNFPELREAFDHDTQELEHFVDILIRELSTASAGLAIAMDRNDADQLTDLKHKLRTSLNLTGADSIKQELARLKNQLCGGQSISPSERQHLVGQLRTLITRLEGECW